MFATSTALEVSLHDWESRSRDSCKVKPTALNGQLSTIFPADKVIAASRLHGDSQIYRANAREIAVGCHRGDVDFRDIVVWHCKLDHRGSPHWVRCIYNQAGFRRIV